MLLSWFYWPFQVNIKKDLKKDNKSYIIKISLFKFVYQFIFTHTKHTQLWFTNTSKMSLRQLEKTFF
jgi:hypothetical protein